MLLFSHQDVTVHALLAIGAMCLTHTTFLRDKVLKKLIVADMLVSTLKYLKQAAFELLVLHLPRVKKRK